MSANHPLLFLVMIMLCLNAVAQTPTAQDCLGAIPICSDVITVNDPYPYSGNGNYLNEILAIVPCYTVENNGIWYTFTVQTSGLLRFVLSPNDPNDDYDWILYNMTNATCGQLNTFGAAAFMESSNNWGVFGVNGDIGISTANGGVGNCNGPGNLNGPKWNADLPVTAGNTYVLYVSNWSNSTFGFSLDFSASTATLFDNVPPAMDTITSAIACDPFDSLVVEFSENVKCNTVQPGDFTLIGPGGPYTITGTSSSVCNSGADYAKEFTIHFTPTLSTTGSYSLAIQPGAGFIEDLCGNLDTLDSLHFDYNGTVDVTVASVEPDCHSACTGTLTASPVGGTSPYQYAWSAGLGTGDFKSGVCAGTYTVTIIDDVGCEGTETLVLGQPDPLAITVDDITNITCFGSTNCEGGADVTVSGGTTPYSYAWPSGETTPSSSALCAGTNELMVTDFNGCQDSVDVIVTIPQPIETIGNGDTLICISNQTPISASSSGGTPPFSYVWYLDSLNGNTFSIDASNFVSPTISTSYFVSSTDANGCIGDTAMVQVNVRPPLGITFSEIDTICPYDDLELTAEGTGGDSIYSYVWQGFGFDPTITVSPDLSEWFHVTVTDLCGTPAKVDSVYVQVGGYSDITVEIRADDDSLCQGKQATLIASSKGGYNGAEEYVFEWEHVPVDYPVQFVAPRSTSMYKVTVSDLCLSAPGTDSIMVYVDKPHTPRISVSPRTACAESDVLITIPSYREGYRYDWILGDGFALVEYESDSLIHNYQAVGCYDIGLSVWTDFGCYSEQVVPCAVNIFQKPKAAFTQQPLQPTNLDPVLEFTNESEDHAEHFWVIQQDTLWDTEQFQREFYDEWAPVPVKLIARTSQGCADTAVKEMDYTYETVFYYPNSFTPNGDGRNDLFIIEGESINPNGFQMAIHDRWGNQVFLSNNPHRPWDGTLNGKPLPLGVYTFELRYRDTQNRIQVVRDQVVISKTNEQKR